MSFDTNVHLLPFPCVLLTDDQGMIQGGAAAMLLGEMLWIDSFFIEESFRGNGWGKDLLQHLEDYAKKRGIQALALQAYLPKALSFYQEAGFIPFHHEKNGFVDKKGQYLGITELIKYVGDHPLESYQSRKQKALLEKTQPYINQKKQYEKKELDIKKVYFEIRSAICHSPNKESFVLWTQEKRQAFIDNQKIYENNLGCLQKEMENDPIFLDGKKHHDHTLKQVQKTYVEDMKRCL